MESSSEEDEQASSHFTRYFLLSLALLACNETGREELIVLTKTSPVAEGRPVEQKEKPPARKKKKKIYLTFDDGPNKGTRNVLNIVKEEKVPVTFFIIGEHAFASSLQETIWDSLACASDSLVEICNHSYTHAWHNRFSTFYKYPDSVVNDFVRCRDSLQLTNSIVRTPGRNAWRIDTIRFTDLKTTVAAVDSLQQAGFVVMGWDLEWHYDHRELLLRNNSDEMIQQIDSLFKKGRTRAPEHLVLLAHDQVYEDPGDSCELHQFIRKLKMKEDYELELATRYPGTKQ